MAIGLDSKLLECVTDPWETGGRLHKRSDVSKTKPKRAKRSGKKE